MILTLKCKVLSRLLVDSIKSAPPIEDSKQRSCADRPQTCCKAGLWNSLRVYTLRCPDLCPFRGTSRGKNAFPKDRDRPSRFKKHIDPGGVAGRSARPEGTR